MVASPINTHPLRMLAAAVAGSPVAISYLTEPGARCWTDGERIYLSAERQAGEGGRELLVQCALLTGGALKAVGLRALVGSMPAFAAGAKLSSNGRAVFALLASASGGATSRIVARLDTTSLVGASRHLPDLIVTEHGVADLRGASLGERAARLVAVADPRHREQLREGWRGCNSSSECEHVELALLGRASFAPRPALPCQSAPSARKSRNWIDLRRSARALFSIAAAAASCALSNR